MDPAPQRILVVDGDDASRVALVQSFRDAGLSSDGVANGLDAISLATAISFSGVVTDLSLPGISGVEVCRRLRASALNADVPILVLTHRGDEVDRVVAFEVGVDDYVVKPYSPRELLLRLRTLLRRTAVRSSPNVTLRYGTLEVDMLQFRVVAGGQEVRLTATEFRLLAAIARRGGAVVSRGSLLKEVWEITSTQDSRTLDTHIKRLREKLGQWRGHVETVRSVGYRLGHPPPMDEALTTDT